MPYVFSTVARPAAFCELVGAVTAYIRTGEKPGPLLDALARLEQYQFHPPIEAKMAV